MALGDQYNNNNKQNYSPTVYSKVYLANPDGIDPSCMTYSFWSGLLKITISPKKPELVNGNVAYDHEKKICIYLSHMKCIQLALEMDKLIADPTGYCSNTGISTRTGLISLSNGIEETGSFNPILYIREVDDDLKPSASYAYQFKKDHYVVQNYNDKTGSFDKGYNELVEIMSFKIVLEEFYKSVVGAYAWAGIEYGKYDNSRMNTKLDSIAKKLGIEYGKDSGYNGNGKPVNKFDKSKTNGGRTYSMNGINDIDDIDNI